MEDTNEVMEDTAMDEVDNGMYTRHEMQSVDDLPAYMADEVTLIRTFFFYKKLRTNKCFPPFVQDMHFNSFAMLAAVRNTSLNISIYVSSLDQVRSGKN